MNERRALRLRGHKDRWKECGHA